MFQQFSRFLTVGATGFITDATVLSILVHVFDYSPYWSRFPSFLVAVTLTWYLNYHWTFEKTKNKQKFQNFGYYLSLQSLGIAINLLIYMTTLYSSNYFFSHPEYAIALASLATLFFNYFSLKKWVFKTNK